MSIKKDLKELSKTGKAVVKELAQSGQFLNKDPDNRMRICLACECYKNNRCSRDICSGADGKPKGCNCFMPLKVKLQAATCPRGKW